MYDLNQPTDVIAQMRDGDMTDEQIIKVCKSVLRELGDNTGRWPAIGDWCTDDVHGRVADVYPRLTLTEEQAESILDAAENGFDANEGFSWETMDYYIDCLVDELKEAEATK